jgi:MFS family permease
VTLGVGVPATFSMTVDLIPTRDRGYAAALITAGAYFAAAVFSSTWRIERFALHALLVLVPGLIMLGLLAFRRWSLVETLAQQHTRPGFGRGRWVRRTIGDRASVDHRMIAVVLLMFGIYFTDSLGFLRLLYAPEYMESAWQSPAFSTHLFIGGIHVIGAFIAGVLYGALDSRTLFLWIFGIFALTHLMYIDRTPVASLLPNSTPTLTMPMLYALTVSLYTVINFAVWADFSTPSTISVNAAIGVASSAWTATFISTALALHWRLSGVSFDVHLSRVAALAMLFFVMILLVWFFQTGRARQPRGGLR